MTVARKRLIDINVTPYYHIINRCVRRAFLCGEDPYSGQNYEHRRQWIVDKVKDLSRVFAVDVCAYAIMSNHYHLVVHVNAAEAASWDTEEVIERWYQLYKGNLLVDRYRNGEYLSKPEQEKVVDCVRIWHQRLQSISWFMQNLNESIAREANAEDKCTGSFWEGRFKSQALLDERALLTCMMYVDLNPIRAGMAQSLEQSDFTSVQERIFAIAKSLDKKKRSYDHVRDTNADIHRFALPQGTDLFPFLGAERNENQTGIAYSLIDYLKLTDWTGRAIRGDKKGAIPAEVKTILTSLNIQERHWLRSIRHFGQSFGRSVGPVQAIHQYNRKQNLSWSKGISANRNLFAVT